MRVNIFVFAAVLILTDFFQSALACDFCAVYNQVDIEGGSKGKFNLGLAYQFTHQESNIRPDGYELFPGQHLESNITQIFGSYGISDSFALQLNIPLIYRDYQRIIEGRVQTGSESGLGDMVLLAKYTPVRSHQEKDSLVWELFGGLKFPTGDSDRLKEEQDAYILSRLRHSSISGNQVGGDDLALGSGSYDGILGTSLFYQREKLYLSLSAQYAIRTEGDYDYQYGNDFQWNIGPGYYFTLQDEQTFSAKLKLSGEHKNDDKISGQSLSGSDEDTVYLGPELWYTKSNTWSGKLGLDIPIAAESSADQVIPKYRILASFIVKF